MKKSDITANDANTKNQKFQKVNKTKLLAHHSLGYLRFFCCNIDKFDPMGVGMAIWHALLPLTATMGAIAKTIKDVNSRELLTRESIDMAIAALKNASIDEINVLILEIVNHTKNVRCYPYKCFGDQKLLEDLKNINPNDRIAFARSLKEDELMQLAKLRMDVGYPILQEKRDKKGRMRQEFTESAEKEISKCVENITPTILNQCSNEQVALLIAYLENSLNAGKKTQHTIVNHSHTF